jgi:hypothetical protein
MNNHSEPGLEASGDPEPNSAHDDTLSPSNMPAPIDYTPVGVFTPEQPVIEQPTGGCNHQCNTINYLVKLSLQEA